jgi:hypothetical protein
MVTNPSTLRSFPTMRPRGAWGAPLSLDEWISAGIRMVDMVNAAAKFDEPCLLVRGEIEDAVVALHNARRFLNEPCPQRCLNR